MINYILSRRKSYHSEGLNTNVTPQSLFSDKKEREKWKCMIIIFNNLNIGSYSYVHDLQFSFEIKGSQMTRLDRNELNISKV